MNTIQPVLVPSTGTLANLHVTTNSSTPDSLHVYWGTALLQVIPRDKNSLLFRIIVGLLLNLKFRIGAVAKAFGVSGSKCADLSRRVQDAWIAFARNGNPSHQGLPDWRAYSLETRNVMVFDTPCECSDDPHGDLRRAWDGVPFDGIRPPLGIRPVPVES